MNTKLNIKDFNAEKIKNEIGAISCSEEFNLGDDGYFPPKDNLSVVYFRIIFSKNNQHFLRLTYNENGEIIKINFTRNEFLGGRNLTHMNMATILKYIKADLLKCQYKIEEPEFIDNHPEMSVDDSIRYFFEYFWSKYPDYSISSSQEIYEDSKEEQ